MENELLAELQKALTTATDELPKVTDKKMFGCYALWANDNVFALVWKHGRIGLKLPDESTYETLMAMKGAEPWKAGPMQMAHWVLVPETFHKKASDLKKWALKAHAQCSVLEKKQKKSTSPKRPVASTATKKKVK